MQPTWKHATCTIWHLIAVIPGATWRANDSGKVALSSSTTWEVPGSALCGFYPLQALTLLPGGGNDIHQFIHFFLIWIRLSFQHLTSPVTYSFDHVTGLIYCEISCRYWLRVTGPVWLLVLTVKIMFPWTPSWSKRRSKKGPKGLLPDFSFPIQTVYFYNVQCTHISDIYLEDKYLETKVFVFVCAWLYLETDTAARQQVAKQPFNFKVSCPLLRNGQGLMNRGRKIFGTFSFFDANKLKHKVSSVQNCWDCSSLK